MIYEWIDLDGNRVEHNHPIAPPPLPGQWRRVFNFGLGAVTGAGGAKARPSGRMKSGNG